MDYIIINKTLQTLVKLAKTYPGVNSDHNSAVMEIKMRRFKHVNHSNPLTKTSAAQNLEERIQNIFYKHRQI